MSSSPVAHRETGTDTIADKQSSSAVGGRPPDANRRDVASWSDCLRQLATALRRRDDDGDQVLTSADVAMFDETATGNQSPPDCKHRDLHGDVQQDQLRSLNDEDYRSSSNNSNHVKKFETSTTVDTGSVDDVHRSSLCNAATVASQLCRGLKF